MKFLVDAQLPRRLARLLIAQGHDTLHTFDLPVGNRTTDEMLRQLARSEGRVLVTKDADFVDSFLLLSLPPRLLFVTTGNIPNDELAALFQANMSAVVDALASHSFVEIDHGGLTIHG